MKHRPMGLTLLGFGHLMMGLGIPLQIMFLYGDTPLEPTALFAKIAPLNWVIMSVSPLMAFFTWRASRVLMMLIPAHLCLLTYNNWLVSAYNQDYSEFATWSASAAIAAVHFLCVSEEVRKVIADPKLRWWRTAKRWQITVPIRLQLFSRATLEMRSKTFDISENGAFIITDQMPNTLAVGTQCFISLAMSSLGYVQCRAEVVRKVEPSGKYPGGIGVKFLGLSWMERRKLISNVNQLSLAMSPS